MTTDTAPSASGTAPTALLLYTTSQTPTPVRYAHPPKPATLIPPLLHTSLHAALDRASPSWRVDGGVVSIPDPRDLPFAAAAAAAPASGSAAGNGHANGNGHGNGNGNANANGSASSASSSGAHTPTTRRASDDPSSLDNELTLRFYLSPGPPAAQLAAIADGVARFRAAKQWARIDTFLLGWRGVDYVGEPTSKGEGCGSMKLASRNRAEAERSEEEGGVSEQVKRDMVEVWRALPSVLPASTVQVGTMSLPLPLLRLLVESSGPSSSGPSSAAPSPSPAPATTHPSAAADPPAGAPSSSGPAMDDASTATATANDISDAQSAPGSATREDFALLASFPAAEAGQGAASGAADAAPRGGKSLPLAVNRLNTPDCHSLPQDLKAFAKERKIQLWAGGTGEGSDPLPSKHLHNTLAEFIPQFPKSHLSSGSTLGSIIPFEGAGSDKAVGVDVRWVIAYTVVSRSRNVVRDKGYMIFADIAGKAS